IQNLPNNKKRYHYLGQKNSLGQIYLTRNVLFEPSSLIDKIWVSSALLQIEKAFNSRIPAIICSHRVNFIGSIFETNRIKNLKLFDELLGEVVKRWPNVEFMNSVQLAELIKKEIQ